MPDHTNESWKFEFYNRFKMRTAPCSSGVVHIASHQGGLVYQDNPDQTFKDIEIFIESLLTQLQEKNIQAVEGLPDPYPIDIFPKPPKGWKEELDDFCKDRGYRIDLISADYARWQRQLTKDDVLTILRDQHDK
jgi:hypothetical protein